MTTATNRVAAMLRTATDRLNEMLKGHMIEPLRVLISSENGVVVETNPTEMHQSYGRVLGIAHEGPRALVIGAWFAWIELLIESQRGSDINEVRAAIYVNAIDAFHGMRGKTELTYTAREALRQIADRDH
jgi:hypothetical protein